MAVALIAWLISTVKFLYVGFFFPLHLKKKKKKESSLLTSKFDISCLYSKQMSKA